MASPPLLGLAGMTGDLRRVEDALRLAVTTSDPYLTELASHLLLAGGKRMRPVVTLAAAQVGGGTTDDDVVQGGISCELVHLGSLYHDDVIDEAATRRGVATVNAKWGNLQAILAGDFLLSRASEIAAGLGTEVAALMARTIGRLCEGEIEQLRHTYSVTRPETSYISAINGKTASLFSAAARVGGIVADLPRPAIDALTVYGEAFGIVFQIVDDILDVTATDEQLGKPAGHDLMEGIYTLPVLRTLSAGGVAAEELRDLLGKPLDAAERDKALAVVRDSGGLAAAIEVARGYVVAAESACDSLPGGAATDALRAAPGALLDDVAVL